MNKGRLYNVLKWPEADFQMQMYGPFLQPIYFPQNFGTALL